MLSLGNPSSPTFEWEIILRNDRMGFEKRFAVPAHTMDIAVERAYMILEEPRSRAHPNQPAYDVDEFVPVYVRRGTTVREGVAA